MSFGKQGWDDIEDVLPEKKSVVYKPKSFWMPAEATKRILFLDADPFCFYEHSLWAITKSSKDKEVCLKRNGISDTCPLCDAELWPSFTGYFTIIDMGDVTYEQGGNVSLDGWTNDKGVTYQFGRKLYGAKRGGRDKPGILKKLHRLAAKRGGLQGTVWDVYRSGSKVASIGDEFEFVTKLEEGEYLDYLIDFGADPDKLNLEPVNYAEHFEPKSAAELQRIVGGGSKGSTEEALVDSKADIDDLGEVPF